MEFTGERFLPELNRESEISIFHLQRYYSIKKLCKDKIVVDAACGEGYGSAMLSESAKYVYGYDISTDAIDNAKSKYVCDNLEYAEANVISIPLTNNSVDVFISFETIEHISKENQTLFLEEIKRVLKDDGILIMSSPDKKRYSDIPRFNNPYHVHELYYDEFELLIKSYFKYSEYYYQGMFVNSYIYPNERKPIFSTNEIQLGDEGEESRAEYIITICSAEKIEETIASVVNDNYNKYYKMKQEIESLKIKLGNPGIIIEQKDNYINEQREIINNLKAIIEQKDNYINEQRKTLINTKAIIEQKENYINEQRNLIQRMYNIRILGRFIRAIVKE